MILAGHLPMGGPVFLPGRAGGEEDQMKFAATVLVIGALLGSTAMPAIAHDHPEAPAPDDTGGGGGPGMGMMGAHKHMGWGVRAYNNQANGNLYTMIAMEAVRSSAMGWFGGFGWYKGLNLAVTAGADMASHGGFLMGKDFGQGPVTFGVGLLLGMGYDLVASPTLTFTGFDAYFVGEPRVSLGWVMNPHAELKLTAGYLGTTNMAQAGGPTVTLTLSAIKLGKGAVHGHGAGACPHCP